MITQEHLKNIFHYDENRGEFTRREISKQGRKKGEVAGCIDKSNGYHNIVISGRKYRTHHLVWLYIYGVLPSDEIDHINHNRADNTPSNLREVSRIENTMNRIISKNNTSGVNGVSYKKESKKWQAQIRVKGHLKFLGYYLSIMDATKARREAEIKYGFHENHGR